jgi:hypothetical protein
MSTMYAGAHFTQTKTRPGRVPLRIRLHKRPSSATRVEYSGAKGKRRNNIVGIKVMNDFDLSRTKSFTAASPRRDLIRGHVWLIVALIGVALMGGLTVVVTPPPMMTPDSPTYLNWSVIRTPGYPFFLSAIRIIDPELGHLPYVQMAMLIASTAFLAQGAARLGGPWWIWPLMGAVILGNPFIWRYSWEILAESLFISLFMTFLGCVAMALQRRPAVVWLFGASGILGAAILARPAGYALLVVAPLIGLLWTGRRSTAVGAATIPAIAILLAVSSWNLATKGYFGTQMFAGYNIGKYDHTLDTAPVANFGIEAPSIELAKQNNAYSTSTAMATIRHHPGDYLSHVLTTFSGLWTFPDISSAEDARIKIPTFAVPLKDGLFFGLMALSFLLVIALALRPTAPLLLAFAAVAALCVNANHLLVALVEEATPRYAMSMWPALMAMLATFAAWIFCSQITATRNSNGNIERDLVRRSNAIAAHDSSYPCVTSSSTEIHLAMAGVLRCPPLIEIFAICSWSFGSLFVVYESIACGMHLYSAYK